MKGLIAKKVGMTQVFDESGNLTPVTVIRVEPNTVVATKTKETCGYDAVVLGVDDMKSNKANKAYAGIFPENVSPKRTLKEFRDFEKEVKVGDSVWGIASRNGISMAQLIKANNIKNNFIYPGQVLKLTAGATTPTTPNTNSGKTYTVKSGDSLWSIAQKNNTSIAQLKSANNLHSDLILVGQVLKLK